MAKFDSNFYRVLALIACLAAAGQLTNTIYVPVLTQMAHDLSVSVGRMQAVIACYLFPYGLFQFFYGPMSDRFGRKPTILIGLLLFIIGSILAIFVKSFSVFLLASLLQGAGIAVGGVMVRTVMRDLYTGTKLHSANSAMSIILIFAPLLAPLIGTLFLNLYSWRAIFAFLSVYGLAIFFIQWFFFIETNPDKSIGQKVLPKYKAVMTNRTFVINLILLIVGSGGVAVFEVSSGALYTAVLKISPTLTSILFIIPLPFYMIGSALCTKAARYYSLNNLLLIGCGILLASGLLMWFSYYVHDIQLIDILLPGCIYFLGCGIIFPTSTTKALEDFQHIAGTAGAVLGGAQNLGAGFLTGLSAFIPLKDQLPLSIILSALSATAILSIYFSHHTHLKHL